MLLAASGCAPKEGRHCAASTLASCADRSSALVCVDGSYSRAICGGPQGCTPRRDGVSCDDTAARPGAICATDGAVACSADATAELVCAAHRFVVATTCHGPDGCAIAADHRLTCDSTRADVDDPCDQENRYACAADLKAQLRCKDRRFVLVNTCMGPGRCQAKTEETSFDCDDDLASAGDPCEDEDDLACSLDHKLRLRCVKGHFADDASCHGPGLCTMRVEGGLKHFAITCP
jgi:7-keto-8-aminopelargonate synthetase-like enzyme